MRRRVGREETNEDQTVRFAWWASFLVTLLVVGLLSIAHSARGAQPLPTGPGDGPFSGPVASTRGASPPPAPAGPGTPPGVAER